MEDMKNIISIKMINLINKRNKRRIKKLNTFKIDEQIEILLINYIKKSVKIQ